MNLDNWRVILAALARIPFLLLELTYVHEEDDVAFSLVVLLFSLCPKFSFPLWHNWRDQTQVIISGPGDLLSNSDVSEKQNQLHNCIRPLPPPEPCYLAVH